MDKYYNFSNSAESYIINHTVYLNLRVLLIAKRKGLEVKEVKEGKFKCFLSFLDENNKTVNGVFNVINLGTLISFETQNGNVQVIPSSRLLKAKFKDGYVYQDGTFFCETYPKNLKKLNREEQKNE